MDAFFNYICFYPHPGGDASLHLVQLLHRGGRRNGDSGIVQERARPPLVADGLLGHEIVSDHRGLAIPPPEYLDRDPEYVGKGVRGKRTTLSYLPIAGRALRGRGRRGGRNVRVFSSFFSSYELKRARSAVIFTD